MEDEKVRYKHRRRPKKRPVKSKKKLMNVEHRTSNIERRMNVFCLFKKDLAKRFHPSKFDILRSAVPAGCQNGQFSNRKTVPFWRSFI
jgi:hypothetical protein